MPSNIVVVCCLNLFSNFHLVCLVVNSYKPKHFLAKLFREYIHVHFCK